MQSTVDQTDHERFTRCIAASKRVRWDIDVDVIRGRRFDRDHKYLPDGLSLVDRLTFLSPAEQRYLSQIQGRTYANVFGLVERYISDKVLELSRDHSFSDQTALEAMIRFTDEELKHQELFRRIEAMVAETMPPGYQFVPDPNDVARAVLSKGTWAVLALTLDIELFSLAHYKESIEPDANLSPLFKDIFLYHWKEESQHAIMDELELRRIDAGITPAQRDAGVDEFIELVAAVDGILQAQSAADARYFSQTCGRPLTAAEDEAVRTGLLAAYRWQYIFSGAQLPQFGKALSSLIDEAQGARIQAALESLGGKAA
jgi:hypothetical protein